MNILGTAMTREFFVVVRNGRGVASCVATVKDKIDRKTVRDFYRDHAGEEIRRVDGDEMARLMTLD